MHRLYPESNPYLEEMLTTSDGQHRLWVALYGNPKVYRLSVCMAVRALAPHRSCIASLTLRYTTFYVLISVVAVNQPRPGH